MSTPVPSLILRVTAAANASGRIGSGIGMFSGAGIFPLGSYGYFDSYPTGTTTCSTVHSDSIPAFSASTARCVSSSGNASGPALAKAIPNFISLLLCESGGSDPLGSIETRERGAYLAEVESVQPHYAPGWCAT